MNAKEFLNRAFYINQRIDSKLEQLESLTALSQKVTTTYSQAPASGSHNNSKMEDTIIKLVMMQEDLNRDIDMLIDTKAEIIKAINGVENQEYRTILEQRYLCMKTWPQIASDLNYGTRNIYIIHGEALKALSKVLETLH